MLEKGIPVRGIVVRFVIQIDRYRNLKKNYESITILYVEICSKVVLLKKKPRESAEVEGSHCIKN